MSILRGTVTSLDASGRPMVEVPALAPGFAYGPLDVAVPVPVLVGDRVVVSPVGDLWDDLIVTGVLGAQDRGGGGGGGGGALMVTTEEFYATGPGPQTLTTAAPPTQVFLVTWSSVPQPSTEFTITPAGVVLADPLSIIEAGDRLTVTYAY